MRAAGGKSQTVQFVANQLSLQKVQQPLVLAAGAAMDWQGAVSAG
jgi:hypothetical protein